MSSYCLEHLLLSSTIKIKVEFYLDEALRLTTQQCFCLGGLLFFRI